MAPGHSPMGDRAGNQKQEGGIMCVFKIKPPLPMAHTCPAYSKDLDLIVSGSVCFFPGSSFPHGSMSWSLLLLVPLLHLICTSLSSSLLSASEVIRDSFVGSAHLAGRASEKGDFACLAVCLWLWAAHTVGRKDGAGRFGQGPVLL